MKSLIRKIGFTFCLSVSISISAYPIDGGKQTGIQRLLYIDSQPPKPLPKGGLLPLEKVQLKLVDKSISLPLSDPQLQRQLIELLGEDKDNYAIAVLDLTDLNAPLFAEHKGRQRFNPGSVGKLLVGLGLFQQLADHYPDDLAARRKFLSETTLVADHLIIKDDHIVSIVEPGTQKLISRPLRIGDVGSVWSYLDWMFSASSNAASSMVLKELIFLRDFGADYTARRADGEEYLKQRPKQLLGQSLMKALQEPVKRNGLDASALQQGGFFTYTGKRAIPGSNSFATPIALIDFLVKMEQGKLVDHFSSVELKRLMYSTQKRIRYASSPALNKMALFFKSGSLYRCKPEADFKCKKYMGNVENLLNSVAIIESTDDGGIPYFYMVALTSNVLRKNSAVAHQTLATRIHQLITARHRSRYLSDQKK